MTEGTQYTPMHAIYTYRFCKWSGWNVDYFMGNWMAYRCPRTQGTMGHLVPVGH